MKHALRALLLLLVCQLPASPAQAACTDSDFMDLLGDPAWDCMFPITIMSIPLDFGEHPPDDEHGGVLCECPGSGIYGIGFQIGYWEPARTIDTVADPWCFPALGMEMDGGDFGFGYSGGGALKRDVANITFQHYHFYVTPLFGMLNMFEDVPCLSDQSTFDLAMVSEVRPDWADDLVAAQYYPETTLMANPITVLACIADAIAATFQKTIDALYWCLGSWGNTYPTSGHMTTKDYVAANAGLAARAMYVQSRNLLLDDRATDVCGSTKSMLWTKSHWRLQEIEPVQEETCHLIGHPGILWTYQKGPVGRQDNYSWLVWRKVTCCVVVY